MVSSDTNGMWPSGKASVPCAARSVICCATARRLVASSCACEANLAASPASLSSISDSRCASCGSATSTSSLRQRRMHDLAVLGDQRALHHLVVEVDLQRLGLLVDHGRDEVQEMPREQRRASGRQLGRQVGGTDDLHAVLDDYLAVF